VESVVRHHTKAKSPFRKLAPVVAFVTALSVLTVPGLSFGTSLHPKVTSTQTLTVAFQSAPATLDPGRLNNGGNGAQYSALAYDSLIYWAPNGDYLPGLATSWKYLDASNQIFQLTIRPNVKFSDGATLTAQDVVNSIEYDAQGSTTAASYLGNLATATATGPLTVVLTFKQPQPDLETIFDQDNMAGDVISPQGLATPTALGTTTDGTGPYMIDPTQTVTGSTYVYVQNPNYWNASLVRFKEVVVDVIASDTSAIAAMQTGQADFFGGSYSDVSAAKAAGLDLYKESGVFATIWTNDYTGKIVKALRNVKVRQAMSYAINRPAIAKALYGSYAQPNDEISTPGFTGYVPGTKWLDYYTYNLKKAKALMKSAGYAKGFTMTLIGVNYQGYLQITEAVASELAAIGIHVKIKEFATFGEYVTAFLSGKYAGGDIQYGTQPMSIESTAIFAKDGLFNVEKNSNPKLLALVAKGNSTHGAVSNAYYQQAMELWIQGAYSLNLFTADNVFIVKPGVASNVQLGLKFPGTASGPDFAFWSPAS